ncbi:MAG: acyltransferase [Victivallales bacterium]|nr:acyltransferase [Victivallales bacterium]
MSFSKKIKLDNDENIKPPSQKKHNYCIDFIKGCACILVVFMHCEFPGRLGMAIQAVSRFCVPFFFMVSGYFAYTEKIYSAWRKIIHIGQITLFASLFYIIVAIVKHFVCGTSLAFSLQDVGIWFLSNKPIIIPGQLWFLYALMYDYVLYAIVVRLRLQKVAYWMIPLLFIAYFIMAQGAYLCGIKLPNFYRNFLIEGFLFFMLGNWLHRNEEKASRLLNDRILCSLVAVSTILCLVERCFLGRDFGVNLFTFPQVIFLFILGMRNSTKFDTHLLTDIGAKLSMYVYILHMFVWKEVVNRTYRLFHISDNCLALYFKPILVLLLTLLISYAVVLVKDCFRRKKERTAEHTLSVP